MQEFNKGVYDYIIATDESGARGEQDTEDEAEEEEEEECESIFLMPCLLFADCF